MPCYHPLTAHRLEDGSISFSSRNGNVLQLPCGRCVGCRLERSRQWAVRIMHEAKSHEANSFLTLTYDEDHVPHDFSLNYRHFQLFFKKLRKRLNRPLRFYMCGEYGEDFARPHYHVCLFGEDFRSDRKIHSSSGSGFYNYTSDILTDVWGMGFATIGDLTFESAAYTARYVMKKINGDAADEHYKVVDSDTGEIYWRVPEFAHMSLKPGIGANWLAQYHSDVYPHDRVIVNGRACKPPRYYDKRYDKLYNNSINFELDDVKFKRLEEALKHIDDNSPERLKAREQVAIARLSYKLRSLK